MNASATHFVRVDRSKNFTCDTMPFERCNRLETAFRSGKWYTDRWRHGEFIKVGRDLIREGEGLVLIGPGVNLQPPQSFDPFFEPIEIAGGVGGNVEQLKIISGEKPTKQERILNVMKYFGIVSGLAAIGGLVYALGGANRIMFQVFGGALLFAMLLAFLIIASQARRARWFLIPGAIAVIRKPIRRGQPPRITVFSREDACLIFRLVSTGKTVILMMELWTHAKKTIRRPVTEREAISVMAAWQSSHTPPKDDKLMELVAY